MHAFFDDYGKPKIVLEIKGTGGTKKIEALIDTGHSDKLSLPLVDLIELGSVLKTHGPVEFGNGARQDCLYFGVQVRRSDTDEFEPVYASYLGSDEAIAGIELFAPYVLTMDFPKREIKLELSR